MASDTQYSENLGATPLVAVDDQQRAQALMAWFASAASTYLAGSDSAAGGSPLSQSGPSIGADANGRLFVLGRTSVDTARGSQSVGTAAPLVITPGMMLLGGLLLLFLRKS